MSLSLASDQGLELRLHVRSVTFVSNGHRQRLVKQSVIGSVIGFPHIRCGPKMELVACWRPPLWLRGQRESPKERPCRVIGCRADGRTSRCVCAQSPFKKRDSVAGTALAFKPAARIDAAPTLRDDLGVSFSLGRVTRRPGAPPRKQQSAGNFARGEAIDCVSTTICIS